MRPERRADVEGARHVGVHVEGRGLLDDQAQAREHDEPRDDHASPLAGPRGTLAEARADRHDGQADERRENRARCAPGRRRSTEACCRCRWDRPAGCPRRCTPGRTRRRTRPRRTGSPAWSRSWRRRARRPARCCLRARATRCSPWPSPRRPPPELPRAPAPRARSRPVPTIHMTAPAGTTSATAAHHARCAPVQRRGRASRASPSSTRGAGRASDRAWPP